MAGSRDRYHSGDLRVQRKFKEGNANENMLNHHEPEPDIFYPVGMYSESGGRNVET